MRRAALLGLVTALTVTGAAYGATAVTNVYTWHAKITPRKSGTAAHPKPVGGSFSFTVTTDPPGYRPNIVKTISIRFQGLGSHTNGFPACGSARLMDPSEGPSTCPRKSKVATGYLIADITTPGNQSPPFILSCRAELTIYNGADHTLTYYVYKGTPPAGQTECPLSHDEAFVATLKHTTRGLIDTFTLPQDLRHPVIGGVKFDAAMTKAVVNVVKVTRRSHGKTIGLFDSTMCPANHERQVAITFTQENGSSRTTTRLVACHY